MKNKDFEIIDKKINSSLDAPESVNKDFVLSALEGSENRKEKTKIIPLKNKTASRRAVPTIAAAVAVVMIAAIGFGTIPKITKTPDIEKPAGTIETLKAYTNYSEIKKDIKKLSKVSLLDRFNFLTKSAVNEDIMSDASSTGGIKKGSAAFGETFKQVEGVDEDDTIKTDGKYIYYAGYNESPYSSDEIDYKIPEYQSKPEIYVFSAEGKGSKLVNTVELEVDDFDEIHGIYLKDNKLIAETSNYNKTTIRIFDISDINHIKKTASFSQSGFFSSSRLIGDRLIVLSTQTDNNDIPFVKCGEQSEKIAADHIYKTDNPSGASFLVASEINIKNNDKIEQAKAVLGGNGTVYSTSENMYVLADISSYDEKKDFFKSESQLFKIDLSDGIRFTRSAKIDGTAKNQYALDEYNSVFRIAVTDNNKNGETVNRLYTFDKELNPLGKLEDFAEGEHIEAVKFIGTAAYVITYETTDPLFVIDLTNPAQPKKLGEVKIDGFSTTLFPTDENHLLGIGTDANNSGDGIQSLKLVLFDISNKAKPKIADEKICKHITSDAMFDTKQILCNKNNGRFTLYTEFFNNVTEKYDSEGDYNYYDYDEEFGCISFGVEGEKIKVLREFKSDVLNSAIGRCTFINNEIYMIDSFHNIDSTLY